jgi:protein SCO1/2
VISTKHNSLRAAQIFVVTLLLSVCAWSQGMGGAMNKGIMSPPANMRPPTLQNVGIEQRLDAQVPQYLAFRDETGKAVKLGDYFGKKPLILDLVYYNCPMLCGESLAGLTGALRLVKFDAGNQFDVVIVSFDPRETPEMAAVKKVDFVKRYGRPNTASGWHFLTGSADSIDALTKAVGFQYQYDAQKNQFAHATAIMALTPQGRISRYFYGVDFPPKDLRMGLVEASAGKIGNAVDQVLLYCYHYDPATGKYGAVIVNILRLAAAATILIMGGFLLIMFRLERCLPPRAQPVAR